jgi:NodT family efflux transporter outer membrane factor (OMF) lipoprotein
MWARTRKTLKGCSPWIPLTTAALLAGCALGPDFTTPEPPPVASLVPGTLKSPVKVDGEGQKYRFGQDVAGEWWRLFRSEALNRVVERALRDNFNLKAARAALRVAQANVRAQQGAFFPLIATKFQSQRQKVSEDPLRPPTQSGEPYFTTHTGQLSVTYAPDVFGGNRRQVESLEATAELGRFELEATLLTLTANIALAAIQEASLRGQIEVTRRIIVISNELLNLQRKRFQLGEVSELDIATQEAELARVEQGLPPLEKQLAQQRTRLIELVGHLPGEGLPEQFHFSRLHLPSDLPVSLPFDIVRQRPDVRAAEASMHVATALVGVAIANRLPQFSLTGNMGALSSKIANALNFAAPYSLWSIAGSVSQVVFDGFTLEQKQRAAEAGLDRAAMLYKNTVVIAFHNVADTLQALDFDARNLRAALAAEEAASKALKLVRVQLTLGEVNTLQVLTAQQTYLTASISVVQARAARFADTVALFQALGGGWWNRSANSETNPRFTADR